MKNIWRNLHVAHDMSGFGHMSGLEEGVRYYCDRAMLLPAETVYVLKDKSGRGLIEEHRNFLSRADVNLGPSRVVQVSGDDIFAGIMSDSDVLENLRRATMRGSLMQVFCMTRRAEAFFAEALIDARHVDSAPLEIASKLNDKVLFRRMGEDMGLSHAFLDYVATDKPNVAVSAVKDFLARPPTDVPFVVVKQADLAGGDGFLKIMREDDLDELLHPYFERFAGRRMLIEEGHPHKALSIQIAVGRRGGFRVVGWTRQLVRVARGQHFGNSMVRYAPGREHPFIGKEHRHTMETWALMFSKYAHERIVGYHGTIGFDIMRLNRPKNGRDLFLLECNARQTASTYPLAVSRQMEGRGLDEWGVTMWNAVPTNAGTFGEVLDRLGKDLVFSCSRGIIPFNARLLTLNTPAVGIIAVGHDLMEAGRMGREAKARLAP